MKVRLIVVGDLREYFGREPTLIELPEGARLQDLLQAIQARWGTALPGYLWDAEKCAFRGPVFLTQNGKVVRDLDAPLADGQDITLVKALAGG